MDENLRIVIAILIIFLNPVNIFKALVLRFTRLMPYSYVITQLNNMN